ncbi:MAG: hypothetical protein Ct9H300mP29_3500 [Candidatus Neomarinimicrobiota bacterium]|nr:MAG: hypothetical protein Ct9H300mP29_3500 [Candidatus Neomarinimicrobiota bacterium]
MRAEIEALLTDEQKQRLEDMQAGHEAENGRNETSCSRCHG